MLYIERQREVMIQNIKYAALYELCAAKWVYPLFIAPIGGDAEGRGGSSSRIHTNVILSLAGLIPLLIPNSSLKKFFNSMILISVYRLWESWRWKASGKFAGNLASYQILGVISRKIGSLQPRKEGNRFVLQMIRIAKRGLSEYRLMSWSFNQAGCIPSAISSAIMVWVSRYDFDGSNRGLKVLKVQKVLRFFECAYRR